MDRDTQIRLLILQQRAKQQATNLNRNIPYSQEDAQMYGYQSNVISGMGQQPAMSQQHGMNQVPMTPQGAMVQQVVMNQQVAMGQQAGMKSHVMMSPQAAMTQMQQGTLGQQSLGQQVAMNPTLVTQNLAAQGQPISNLQQPPTGLSPAHMKGHQVTASRTGSNSQQYVQQQLNQQHMQVMHHHQQQASQQRTSQAVRYPLQQQVKQPIARPPEQQQQPLRQPNQQRSDGFGPHQFTTAIAEKARIDKESVFGVPGEYEKCRKRPLENEQKLFWDEPLPARLVAGLSLLEADNALTAGHHLGGANDIWQFLDPMPSPATVGNNNSSRMRVGGAEAYRAGGGSIQPAPQEYLYAECSLSGIIDTEQDADAVNNVIKTLGILCDVHQRGLWKDECWRVKVDEEGAPVFLNSSQRIAKEVWIRRYLLPTHLQHIFATRIYSPQYLAVPPQFPTNARLVKECTSSPSILSILVGIGFERCPPNDVYVKGLLFHVDAGTNRHIIVTITRIYTNRYMSEEMFPGKLFVEAKARSERPGMMNTLAACLTELATRLRPHVVLVKA